MPKKCKPLIAPLFVPGNRPERFEKAAASGTDMVILDLEDAVPSDGKEEARTHIKSYLSNGGFAVVRINARTSPYFDDDMESLKDTPVASIIIPKYESREDAIEVQNRLGTDTSILPLVETAAAFPGLSDALTAPGVFQAAIGTLDLAADLGCAVDGSPIGLARARIVFASRLANIAAPVDGVTTDVKSPDTIDRDSADSRQTGFGGKLCIHPNQVVPVTEAFRPTEKEQAWAARVMEIAESGVGVVDGEMIDAPVIRRAERILAYGTD